MTSEAWLFAYPVLLNYKTLYEQAVDQDFPGYVGGFNRFRHYARAYTPADTDIVTPNNDTPYSWAWLDLRAEPVARPTRRSPVTATSRSSLSTCSPSTLRISACCPPGARVGRTSSPDLTGTALLPLRSTR